MKTYKNCGPERVLLALETSGEPMTSRQLSEATGIARQRTIDVLTQLRKDGRVTREGTRKGFEYAIAKTGDSTDGMATGPANNQGAINLPAEVDSAEVEPVSPVRSED